MKSTLLAFVYICLSLVGRVHLKNSQECEVWCDKSNGESCSPRSPCYVKYYQDLVRRPQMNASRCCQIKSFTATRLLGNATWNNLTDDCRKLRPSKLGIELNWMVRGKCLKNTHQILMSIRKKIITEEGSTDDLVRIRVPKRKEPLLNRYIHFRYVYRGSDDSFYLNYNGHYVLAASSDDACNPTTMDRDVKFLGCPEPPPPPNPPNSIAWKCIVPVFIIVIILIGIGVLFVRNRHSSKDKGRDSQVIKILLLLNPGIVDADLTTTMNTIATKINRYQDMHVDCNFWNKTQAQYEWVNSKLPFADIAMITSPQDSIERAEPTFTNFDKQIVRLFQAKSYPKFMTVHGYETERHKRCPFMTDNRCTATRIHGDAERDVAVLRKRILDIVGDDRPEGGQLLL